MRNGQELVSSEWDRLVVEMRGESLGAGSERCGLCGGVPYYDAAHLANPGRSCKVRKQERKKEET